jgi:integrase
LPARTRVHGVNPSTVTPKRGPKAARTITVYDVRYTVDGFPFSMRFERKGHANAFAEQLRDHSALGYRFDPTTRRFLEPANAADTPTLVVFTAEYFARQWPSWSPNSRRNNQRELAVACVYIVRDDAPALTGPERVGSDRYLRRAVLVSPTADQAEPADDDARWAAWFDRWSPPMPDVTPTHLHRFLDTIRVEALDGTRRTIDASTVQRYRVAIRAVFNAATAERIIEWNPWNGVKVSLPTDEDDDLDPDLVMNQRQVGHLAHTCGTIQPRARAFVLIQGVCGLRPSEARELRRRDLDVDIIPATVTVRGSRTDVPDRFLDPGESRRRPLKGRGRRARRVIPIPRHVVPIVREHLDRYVDNDPDALVFTSLTGKPINMSNFHRDVWHTARTRTFPAGSRLRSVRRHDLRHAAITTWLNAGVTIKTCQRWSGHKRASVLLDTYLGVTVDDSALSVRRVEDALDAAYDGDQADDQTATDAPVSSQNRRKAHGKDGDQEGDHGQTVRFAPWPRSRWSAPQSARFAW